MLPRTAGKKSSGRAVNTPRVLFLGCTYAGHSTRFSNLEAHTREDARIDARFRRVSGWNDGGLIERLPLVPGGVKGRARSLLQTASIASLPRPDAIWSSTGELLGPFLWSQMGPLRRPLALDFDYTLEQQESLAHVYYNRAARGGLRYALTRLHERLVWRSVSLFTPWSRWAAESLVRQGVDPARIRVQPPGVDLDAWRMPERRGESSRPLRLLFVGGDFARKGGQILLDVLRTRADGRFALDVVTRDDVACEDGVRVHRAEPNSPELRELYARADVFVLPTRAEAFGIATVEAMASGIPVIVSDVGGARDIVDDGETGWLIEPETDALAAALDLAYERREQLAAMGARARAVAEQRFDGRRNDGVIVDMLLEEIERSRGGKEAARRGHRQQV